MNHNDRMKLPFSAEQELVKTCDHRLTSEDLVSDFSMTRLNDIHQHLWFAGSLGHYGTLHHQRVLLRTIIPSASPRLHLVWHRRIIYIMPLPDCLLNASYYSDIVCKDLELYSSIIGFLRSYCFLIRYPLDLTIAQELHLFHQDVMWKQWIIFREAVLKETDASVINKRYEYGELRLHRLNLIYRFTGRGLFYFTTHREYQTYFGEYFAIFATVFAFVATALTAMQVVIGISTVPELLILVCYRFSIAVLVGICACFGYVGTIFVAIYSYKFAAARASSSKNSKLPSRYTGDTPA